MWKRMEYSRNWNCKCWRDQKRRENLKYRKRQLGSIISRLRRHGDYRPKNQIARLGESTNIGPGRSWHLSWVQRFLVVINNTARSIEGTTHPLCVKVCLGIELQWTSSLADVTEELFRDLCGPGDWLSIDIIPRGLNGGESGVNVRLSLGGNEVIISRAQEAFSVPITSYKPTNICIYVHVVYNHT